MVEKPELTEEMKDRVGWLSDSKLKDEGNGYFSIYDLMNHKVAYIQLPKDHPDIGKDYDDFNPDVNGGLTYSKGPVFGWDYNHYHNDLNVEGHIKNALEYFRERAKPHPLGGKGTGIQVDPEDPEYKTPEDPHDQ